MRQLETIDFLSDEHLIRMVRSFDEEGFLWKRGLLNGIETWDFNGLGTLDHRCRYTELDRITLGDFFTWTISSGWIRKHRYCRKFAWGRAPLEKLYSRDVLTVFCEVLLTHHSIEEILTYNHGSVRLLGKIYLQETGELSC